jgi:hypothetical protein
MRSKERFFDVVLGVMVVVTSLVMLLGLYIVFKSTMLLLVLLIILLPIMFSGTKLIYRPREKVLTIDDLRKKVLKLKKRKFLAFILGV